jgi:hypothetical protein
MAISNILRTFGILYNNLVSFVFIGYIFSVLVLCTKKNLAILVDTASHVTANGNTEKKKIRKILRNCITASPLPT